MSKISAFIGLGTGCFFIFMGILMAVRPPAMFKSPQSAILFGVVLSLYGAFRVFRAYKWIKSE